MFLKNLLKSFVNFIKLVSNFFFFSKLELVELDLFG
jgi:hypothetical protein